MGPVKRQGICIALTCLVAGQLLAANQRTEFDAWMQDEIEGYGNYRDSQDRAFTEFLKLQWQEMQVFQGLQRDSVPKPVEIPVAQKPELAPGARPEKKKTPVVPPASKMPEQTPQDQAPPRVSVTPIVTKKIANQARLQLNFYGHTLVFDYDAKTRQRLGHPVDKDSISDYWSRLGRSDYSPLISQLKNYQQQLQLNDWAYILLINSLSHHIYGNQDNEQALLCWFMLSKLGYQVRVGYDANRVYLLAASQHTIYASRYFTFDGDRYYVLALDKGEVISNSIYTYDGHYPGAGRPLDMRLLQPLNTRPELKARQLEFSFDNVKHHVSVDYDIHTVAFMDTYPQLDIALYFMTPVYQQTSIELIAQLKKLIAGRPEQEAINLLLRFVQTAFSYKTDQQQFGGENYLFSEETIYYPYSDCEDRSVLFAWLVRELLGLEVIGLDYPGHIATAVRLKYGVKGDAVMFNQEKYYIADPTYINAGIGMTMPMFKNTRPKIIQIRG